MRILVVDDHEIVRRGLKQLLGDVIHGAEFTEVATAPQAREELVRGAWDLILLDINLPGGSGLELLGELKRLHPRTPALVLSSYPEEEFAIRSLKLGADGYLTKSSVADEMITAVRRVMAGGRYVSASLAERLAATIGRPSMPHEALSPRELEVLRLVASGRSIREIAEELSLSEKTIGTYRSRISEKLGLSTNVELTRYALRHGLAE